MNVSGCVSKDRNSEQHNVLLRLPPSFLNGCHGCGHGCLSSGTAFTGEVTLLHTHRAQLSYSHIPVCSPQLHKSGEDLGGVTISDALVGGCDTTCWQDVQITASLQLVVWSLLF